MKVNLIILAGIGFLIGFNLETISKFVRIYWQSLWYKYRINKAINKWNKDIPYIQKCIEESKQKTRVIREGVSYHPCRVFYWEQLVWQEIKMYISLGQPVDLKEFIQLCGRRGFTLNEQNYLRDLLRHVGLWKIKPNLAVGHNPPPKDLGWSKKPPPPPAPPKKGN